MLRLAHPTFYKYEDIRICFVGDSYVQGTGDPEYLGWAGRLCVNARRAGHNLTGYNLGVRRETSADIARRWLGECAPRLPAATDNYVLFSFGLNDVTLLRLSDGMAEVTAGLGVPYLALFPHFVNDAQWLDEVRQNDGAHPRATGYAKIAALIEAWPQWWFRT